MPHYELRPFQLSEAEMVAHWIVTPDELWNVAASKDFPLEADQIVAWTWEADFAFTLRCQGDLAAYAEILEDEVDQDVEIQHLIVAPDQRAQGIGKAMLTRLCAFLAEARSYREVWVRIGRDNPAAARCALAAGFEEQPQQSGERYLWLKKTLQTAADLQKSK